MPSPSEKVRVFIAAYPPREVIAHLQALAEALELPSHRLSEDVHLTIHFVGPVERRELDEVRETLSKSCAGIRPFDLMALRLIGLPAHSPRLLAAELSLPPDLAELQRRLCRRLATKPSKKPYLPHLTLRRWQSGPLTLAACDVEPMQFRVTEVYLMRSVLKPDGAEHHLLGRERLRED